MATPIYSAAASQFDPSKQTYLDYLNTLTGYGQNPGAPSNPFPAETSMPAPPKPNALAQGAQNAGTVGQIADWATGSSPAVVDPSTVSTPLTGSSIPASGYPATETLLAGGSQEGIAQGMSMAPTGGSGWLGATGANPWLAGSGYVAGAATGMAQLGGLNNVIKNESMSVPQQVALALPTFGASFLYNPARKLFGGKKHGDQVARDSVRSSAQEAGWFGNNFEVPLAESGITLDMGKDGGFRYQNADGSERPVYNMDWDNDPLAGQGVGWLKPLGLVLGKGDVKAADDFTAQLYNELTKDGQIKDLDSLRKRVVELYNQFKLKPSFVAETINMMDLPPELRDPALAAIDNLKPGRGPQVKAGVQPLAQHTKPPSMKPEEPKKPDAPPAMGTGATKPEAVKDPKPQGRPAPQKPMARGAFNRA
jgi:hypothetical protein